MPFTLKKKWVVTICIILGLFVLNPTLQQFEDFIGHSPYRLDQHNLTRSLNLMFLSVYNDQEVNTSGEVFREQTYIGFLRNFIHIPTSESLTKDKPPFDPSKPFEILDSVKK